MPLRSTNLNGNVPHNAKRVLILIDTINDLEWKGAERMMRQAHAVAEAIRRLGELDGDRCVDRRVVALEAMLVVVVEPAGGCISTSASTSGEPPKVET